MGVPLYVICRFFLVAFNNFCLSLIFVFNFAVHGFLIAVAFLVVEHELYTHGLQ